MVCRSLTHLTLFAGSVAGSALMFVCSPDRTDVAFQASAGSAEVAAAPADVPAADLDEVDVTRRELDRQVAVMTERINTKELLIRDLVDGRTTLREVAEKFHRMNVDFPACMSVIRSRYPGMTDEERMARNVLEFVHLQGLPADRLKAVEARLEEEFYRAFGHGEAITH